jgi:hypothetical protein
MAKMDFKNMKNTTKMLKQHLKTPIRQEDQNKLHKQWSFEFKISKTCPEYQNTL